MAGHRRSARYPTCMHAGSLPSSFRVNPFDHTRHVPRRESYIPEHLLGARPAKVLPVRLENQLVGVGPIECLLLPQYPAALLDEEV